MSEVVMEVSGSGNATRPIPSAGKRNATVYALQIRLSVTLVSVSSVMLGGGMMHAVIACCGCTMRCVRTIVTWK